MRILLVEDDPMVADGIREGLEKAGFAVDHTAAAEPAESALELTHYDLKDPQRVSVPAKPVGAIGIALVIGVAVVKPVSRGKMLAEEASRSQAIHVGELIVNGNPR